MKNFSKLVRAQFDKMCATGKLFKTGVDGYALSELYVSSFSEEHNPVFRSPESSRHNCNLCKAFVRRYGNIVAIIDNKLVTMWDVEGAPEEYKPVAEALNKAVLSMPITSVFLEDYSFLNLSNYEKCNKNSETFKLGLAQNFKIYSKEEAEMYGKVTPGIQYEFNHLSIVLPKKFVRMNQCNAEISQLNTNVETLKKGFAEISIESLDTFIEMNAQGALLNSDSYVTSVKEFKKFLIEFQNSENKEFFLWSNCDNNLAYFKNNLAGVACYDFQEKSLEDACRVWNMRVDPINYKKAKAPITQTQINLAKKFVEENNYVESFDRRLAKLEDIRVDEILHMNVTGSSTKGSIFDSIVPTKNTNSVKDFSNVPEISIKDFMSDVLPGCTSAELYVENKHEMNFVCMTTASSKECKNPFSWDNPYSWTYKGNLAGKSFIKEAVKKRGGDTEGVLNIRLYFPNTISDYDLISVSEKEKICFRNVRKRQNSSGMLDLDAQGIDGHFEPDLRVENISFNDISKMKGKRFVVSVMLFSNRDNIYDFNMEVEDAYGHLTTIRYQKEFNTVDIVTITVDMDGKINYEYHVPVNTTTKTKEIWGLDTNKFHKINLLCTSPNYWGNNCKGNLHYFFMIDNCKVSEPVRSFHNENLNHELSCHRKVMDTLANTTMITPEGEHLAGIGFNATVRENAVIKVSKDNKTFIYKINF